MRQPRWVVNTREPEDCTMGRVLASALACAVWGCAVHAQTHSTASGQAYPAKPVRVLLGFPPGAGVDITTRLVTTKMSESLGRQFIVDNRAGAAGNIAVEVAARAAPDGYTLLGVTAAAAVS